MTREGSRRAAAELRLSDRGPPPGRRLPGFGPGARLFRVCTRPSQCTQRPNLLGGPAGPGNAPRSRARPGLTTLLGAATGRRPEGHTGRPSAPLGRRRTTSSEAAIPRPRAERKEAERLLLGGTRKRPSDQVIGRTRAPRSTGDVERRAWVGTSVRRATQLRACSHAPRTTQSVLAAGSDTGTRAHSLNGDKNPWEHRAAVRRQRRIARNGLTGCSKP
jgi:hypothetical protein